MKDLRTFSRVTISLILFCCFFVTPVCGQDYLTKESRKLLEKQIKENPNDFESLAKLYRHYNSYAGYNSEKANKTKQAMLLINKPKTLFIIGDEDGLRNLTSSTDNAEKMDLYYYLGTVILSKIRYPITLEDISGRDLFDDTKVEKLSFPYRLYEGMNYLKLSQHEDEFQEFVKKGLTAAKEMDRQIATLIYKNIGFNDDKFHYIDALNIYMPLAILGVQEAKDRMNYYINGYLTFYKYEKDYIWLGIMADGLRRM